MGRGDRRTTHICSSAPFVWQCLSGVSITPFPHPAHRTEQAVFPHSALGQEAHAFAHGRLRVN